MTESKKYTLKNATIELQTEETCFIGVGAVWIGETKIRSGRLPIQVKTTSFSGFELRETRLRGVQEGEDELRIQLDVDFLPSDTKLMRDHSFDPIHETSDWDSQSPVTEELDLVFRPAEDSFNGIQGVGFSYHYEYRGKEIELFYLLDYSSWELEGDITGGTAVSQSSCSDPLGIFDQDTAWTTEGVIHWDPDMPNKVMTHNLPRWASHQAFDFQWKNGRVLLGVFEQVDLIRTLLKREPGSAELKVFDKHIFDQSAEVSTTPKKILLVEDVATETAMQNLWSWVFEDVHNRARAEFGLKQEPTLPRVSQNYWQNWTVDSYYKDLLPAASAMGVKQIFIDNVNRNDYTEKGNGNMCCGQEYEPAPSIGGETKLKEFVDRAKAQGIQVMSWTNNDQSYSSPLNASERDEKGWFVKMEDTRLKYGGAYTNVFTILDFGKEAPRQHWVDCLKKTRETTGLDGYLFDSFYNLGFMPVNYSDGKPSTMWRGTLAAFKELQDADVHFLIESFGPFGQSQHGCPKSYSIDRCWTCYEIGVGNDYSTVPTNKPRYFDPRSNNPETLHYILAHKTLPPMPIFRDNVRIDETWTEEHRRALADYHEVMHLMKRRYLQTDGKSIIWHDAEKKNAVLFVFEGCKAMLPGSVRDVTSGVDLPSSEAYDLAPMHTYVITGDELPVTVESI